MDPDRPTGSVPARKPIVWRGSSLEVVRGFPVDARRQAGFQLGNMQDGGAPDDWKPFPAGPGCIEIRIHSGGEYRVIVVARFSEAVYVLHAFKKTSRKTRKLDVNLARARYAALVAEVRK